MKGVSSKLISTLFVLMNRPRVSSLSLDEQVNVTALCVRRTIGDRIGEAKASGNLGNTLKVLGRYDEAVVCCQRHLDISQEQGDKVGTPFSTVSQTNILYIKNKSYKIIALFGVLLCKSVLSVDELGIKRITGCYSTSSWLHFPLFGVVKLLETA